MRFKDLFLWLLVFFIGGVSLIKAQKTDNFCTNCGKNKEVVCVSSKELKRRTIFINDLYVPSTAGLTKIKDKTVFINILVNSEGNVTKAIATRGHPLLKSVGVSLTKNAKFSPMKIGDKSKNMCGRLVLKWKPNK